MRKINTFRILAVLFVALFGVQAYAQSDTTTIRLYDNVVFYDGYNGTVFDAGLDDGILRIRNALYSVKMTPEQLDQFGDKVEMHVTIKALCDNYDRVGNINLALVPKGRESYNPYSKEDKDIVKRLEIGRFITPFMNMNIAPDTVPFFWQVDFLSNIFHDTNLREQYDIWVEFELFGIPYAANQQVSGCEGRNDVFAGTLEFRTSKPAAPSNTTDVLVPLWMKVPEDKGGNLNNYQEGCTDEIGTTQRTFTINLDEDISDGMFMLVLSNHGADAGGEEYSRRWHYIYFDDELINTFMPGRETCEPFRKYNTQSNGIYGILPKTDAAWQSFSNWCPGDVVDNRCYRVGAVSAGEHTFRISVPDAQFYGPNGKPGSGGDIRISLFFQGVTEGQLPESALVEATPFEPEVTLKRDGDNLSFASEQPIVGVELYSVSGQKMYSEWKAVDQISLAGYDAGIYLVNLYLENGVIETHKILK